MKTACFLLTLGLGMAAGATVCAMLPQNCEVKKAVDSAAESLECAAKKAVNSLLPFHAGSAGIHNAKRSGPAPASPRDQNVATSCTAGAAGSTETAVRIGPTPL